MYNVGMNTKNIKIIIGIIAVVIVGVAIIGSLRQKANIENTESVEGITNSTSTKKSVSAVITEGVPFGTENVSIISGISTQNMGSSNVIVSWVTSLPVITEIHFSDVPLKQDVARQMIRDTKLKTTHAVELTSLAPFTTYYYTIVSANAKEKIATSTAQGLFKTIQK